LLLVGLPFDKFLCRLTSCMWGEREVRGLAREGKEREGIGLRERRK